MRMGAHHLGQVIARATTDGLPKGLPEGTNEASAEWVAEFVMRYGHAHYYENADGSRVHSMEDKAYDKIKPGAVAIVPVRGLVVKEADPFEEAYWGLTSTERLATVFAQLTADDRVVGAVQRIFSPGGQVFGTEAYGGSIATMCASKQVVSSIDHLCASAGYWGACGSSKILLEGKTSEVGSIGVMMAWWDMIPYLERIGFKYHEYYAPESGAKNEEWRAARKGDPKPIEEGMSPTAQLFIATVQAGRGDRLDASDKKILQGRMYSGDAAIAAGLADGYGTLADAIQEVRKPTPVSLKTKPAEMNIKNSLAAIAALFSGKVEASQQDIDEANKTLAEKEITNVLFMSTADQKRATDSAALIADAEGKAKASESKATAAAGKVTTAEEATAKANADLKTATDAANATLATASAACAKHTIEAKEGVSSLDQLVAALDARTAELAIANAKVTKLEADPADDGKAAGVVDEKGDVNDHGKDDELSPEEKAFRGTSLR